MQGALHGSRGIRRGCQAPEGGAAAQPPQWSARPGTRHRRKAEGKVGAGRPAGQCFALLRASPVAAAQPPQWSARPGTRHRRKAEGKVGAGRPAGQCFALLRASPVAAAQPPPLRGADERRKLLHRPCAPSRRFKKAVKLQPKRDEPQGEKPSAEGEPAIAALTGSAKSATIRRMTARGARE